MKENIEEDIRKIEGYIELVLNKGYCECNELNEIIGKHCDGSKNVAYVIDELLSDYKRVLKENEKLKKQNYDLLRKLKNRVKEVRKLEKYSMYKKEFSTLNKKVNELQKENEELKKFITEGITIEPNSPYKNYRLDFLRENFIPVQKLKDKIEELNNHYKKEIYPERFHWVGVTITEYYVGMISLLQELLESEG